MASFLFCDFVEKHFKNVSVRCSYDTGHLAICCKGLTDKDRACCCRQKSHINLKP